MRGGSPNQAVNDRLARYRGSLLWDVEMSSAMFEVTPLLSTDPPQKYVKLSPEPIVHSEDWQVQWGYISLMYATALECHEPSMTPFDRTWCLKALITNLSQILVGPRMVPIRFRECGRHNLQVEDGCRLPAHHPLACRAARRH